ncbi:hypothetical protein AB0G05_15965 [Nonomuraea wenchangensis]
MDHAQAPVLRALQAHHDSGQLPFTPPGHKQGRGIDPRVAAVMGEALFRDDVLVTGGLDDRSSSGGVLQRAEEAVVPGERLNGEVLRYLRSGLAGGMVVPDSADSSLGTFRVVAEEDHAC